MNFLQNLIDDHWRPLPSRIRAILVSLVLGVVVLLVALLGFSGQGQPVASPVYTPTNFGTAAAASTAAEALVKQELLIQVVGAVVQPGVYQLDAGSRVMDAVAAAGGFTKNADQASINLVRMVADAEQIVVATVAESAVANTLGGGSSPTGGNLLGGKLNLNRATAVQLDTLPGIGPTLAARIIDYRKANGLFGSVNDLTKVAGIGPRLLSQIAPKVTV